MATLTQEQINNYKRMGIPIPAGTTVYGQTSTTPAKSTSAASSSTISQQIASMKATISDLQAQQAALKKYNVTDTNQLTKNASGQYVPAVVTKTLDSPVAAAGPTNISKSLMAYKDTAAYQSLSADAKSFIDEAYKTIEVGGEAEAAKLSQAINQAIAIADPYYAKQLELAKAEITASIAKQTGDYETAYRTIENTKKRLAEDVAAESSYLTLEQQADIATVMNAYDEDMLSIADEAAEKGLGFAYGARSKIIADQRRTTQMQDVVQSSRREYNYKINELKLKAQRGDEDAAAELADLEKSNTLSLQKIGRTAEAVLGSANIPSVSGYTPVGGVLGSLEEEKRKSIISDVGGFMSLQSGLLSAS